MKRGERVQRRYPFPFSALTAKYERDDCTWNIKRLLMKAQKWKVDIENELVCVVFHRNPSITFIPLQKQWRYHSFFFNKKTLRVKDPSLPASLQVVLPNYLEDFFKEKNLLLKTMPALDFIHHFKSQEINFENPMIDLTQKYPFSSFFYW